MNATDILISIMFLICFLAGGFLMLSRMSLAFTRFTKHWEDLRKIELEGEKFLSFRSGFKEGQRYEQSGDSRGDTYDQIAMTKEYIDDKELITLEEFERCINLLMDKLIQDYTKAQENEKKNWITELEYEFNDTFLVKRKDNTNEKQ